MSETYFRWTIILCLNVFSVADRATLKSLEGGRRECSSSSSFDFTDPHRVPRHGHGRELSEHRRNCVEAGLPCLNPMLSFPVPKPNLKNKLWDDLQSDSYHRIPPKISVGLRCIVYATERLRNEGVHSITGYGHRSIRDAALSTQKGIWPYSKELLVDFLSV